MPRAPSGRSRLKPLMRASGNRKGGRSPISGATPAPTEGPSPEKASASASRIPLSYSPTTGHVSRSGAVIGRIETDTANDAYLYYEFKFGAAPIAASTLPALLALIREAEERKRDE